MSVTGQLRGSANYIWSPNDVVGRGATGEVYKCRSKRNGDVFAVKTFNNYSFMRPRDVQKRELNVIQKLDHINIVKTMAVEEEISTGQQVIVMEYCDGGSVYSVLDEPEFMFGIPEEEFLIILKHIADGMQYLRQKQVVHRDIKPGNILRLITDDKRYVYKLSDFGAARELHHEEENFMSMHGTEEYLDPSVYERAVMGQGHGRTFDASVDLWSLGVTLYHIAAGQLPFRPFGGRKNKNTMFEIHSKKAPGVISGVQETEGGAIKWSRELPPTCLVSQGLRDLITPVIAGLLEVDAGQKMSYEEFFRAVDLITNKKVFNVFHTASCASLRVYLDPYDSYAKLQEAIAEQTDIPANNQHLVFEFRELRDIVKGTQQACTYPFKTSVDNPIFVFFDQSITEFRNATFFEIPRFPKFGTVFSLDNDAPLAKQCAGLMYLIGRHIAEYNRVQVVLKQAVQMYLWQIAETSKSTKEQLDAVENPNGRIREQCHEFKSSFDQERRLVGLMFKGKGPPSDLVKFFQETEIQIKELQKNGVEACTRYEIISRKCEEFYDKIVTQDELASKWDSSRGCVRHCNEELAKLIESVDATRVDFKRDKQLKRLTYNEEQIHKVQKNAMNAHCSRGVTMAQSQCYPGLKQLHQLFKAWFCQRAHPIRCRVLKIREDIVRENERQMALSTSISQKRAKYGEHMDTLISQLESGRVAISPGQFAVDHTVPQITTETHAATEEVGSVSDYLGLDESLLYQLNPLQLLEAVNTLKEQINGEVEMQNANNQDLISLHSMTTNANLHEEGGYQTTGVT